MFVPLKPIEFSFNIYMEEKEIASEKKQVFKKLELSCKNKTLVVSLKVYGIEFTLITRPDPAHEEIFNCFNPDFISKEIFKEENLAEMLIEHFPKEVIDKTQERLLKNVKEIKKQFLERIKFLYTLYGLDKQTLDPL